MSLLSRIVLVVFGLLVISWWFRTGPRDSAYFVHGAVLAEPGLYPRLLAETGRPPESGFRNPVALRGHHLLAGTGLVLASRTYDPGNRLAIDDEHFTKLTIALPESLAVEGRSLIIGDLTGVRANYSVGGSAWPESACASFAESGTVTFERIVPRRMTVRYELVLVDVYPLRSCGPSTIGGRLALRGEAFERLTPVQGRVSDSTRRYRETYPWSRAATPR